MNLTTKGRYAVTAMLDLCIHGAEGPIPLCEIARRQGISAAYLEQLFGALRRQKLITSMRGANGGYQLARLAKEISVADIVHAVSENVDATRCQGEENCQDSGRCLTHDLWQNLSAVIVDFLESQTLESLAAQTNTQRVAQRQSQGIPMLFEPAVAGSQKPISA